MKINLLVKQLRQFRHVHKFFGIGIGFFLFITAMSGILLGWKKDVELLQPPTLKGVSGDLLNWRSFYEISVAAKRGMDSIGQTNNTIDRFDVRPDKGIIKVFLRKDIGKCRWMALRQKFFLLSSDTQTGSNTCTMGQYYLICSSSSTPTFLGSDC